MRDFTHNLTVIGPNGEETIDAVVDTGAFFSWVPATILHRLGVQPTRHIPLRLADGRVIEHDAGEARMRINGSEQTTVCVFGDEGSDPLLGAYTLEGFLLAADPVNGELIPRVARAVSPRLA